MLRTNELNQVLRIYLAESNVACIRVYQYNEHFYLAIERKESTTVQGTSISSKRRQIIRPFVCSR